MKRASDEGAKSASSRPGKASKSASSRPGKKASSKQRLAPGGSVKAGAPKAPSSKASAKAPSSKLDMAKGRAAKEGARKKQRNIVIPDTVIGRVERVDLPGWDVTGLKAKVDTGARTSSIHVEEIRVLTRNRLRFAVVQQNGERRWVQAAISRTGRVRSSNGQMENRYFVTTEMTLGPITKEVEISLSDRESMTYRMLLGRLALEGDFLVDVSHRFIANRTTRRRGEP